MIILAIAGYIVGLLTQPLSSRLTTIIESRFGPLPEGVPDGYVFITNTQRKLRASSREIEASVLGKRHAEITFFVQLAALLLLAVIVVLVMCIPRMLIVVPLGVVAVVILGAILDAIGMVMSLMKHARRLDDEMNTLDRLSRRRHRS
jgi:hypothetical protein